MLHPDEGTIHAWLDGQLPADERAKLEQHFDQCDECSALVVEARGLVAGATRIVGALDGVRGGVIPPATSAAAKPSRSLWRTLRLTPVRAVIAATLLLATGTIFTIQQDKRQTHDMAAPMAASPASAPVLALDTATRPQAKPSADAAPQIAAASTPRAASTADSIAAERREVVAEASKSVRQGDSIAMRDAKAAAPATSPTSLTSPTSPRRAFAGAINLSENIAAGMPGTNARAIGCYRLGVDSARAEIASLRQFGLSTAEAGRANVVRSFANADARDSIVASARWRTLGDSVVVSAPTNGGERATLVFALAEEGRSASGRLTTAGQTTPIQVLRTRCP